MAKLDSILATKNANFGKDAVELKLNSKLPIQTTSYSMDYTGDNNQVQNNFFGGHMRPSSLTNDSFIISHSGYSNGYGTLGVGSRGIKVDANGNFSATSLATSQNSSSTSQSTGIFNVNQETGEYQWHTRWVWNGNYYIIFWYGYHENGVGSNSMQGVGRNPIDSSYSSWGHPYTYIQPGSNGTLGKNNGIWFTPTYNTSGYYGNTTAYGARHSGGSGYSGHTNRSSQPNQNWNYYTISSRPSEVMFNFMAQVNNSSYGQRYFHAYRYDNSRYDMGYTYDSDKNFVLQKQSFVWKPENGSTTGDYYFLVPGQRRQLKNTWNGSSWSGMTEVNFYCPPMEARGDRLSATVQSLAPDTFVIPTRVNGVSAYGVFKFKVSAGEAVLVAYWDKSQVEGDWFHAGMDAENYFPYPSSNRYPHTAVGTNNNFLVVHTNDNYRVDDSSNNNEFAGIRTFDISGANLTGLITGA